MLIVKKFGGTSVANKERIFNVVNRVAEDYRAGHQVIVVLSAMGKQTDVLLDMARDINPDAPKRELDMLVSTGEQVSVALASMAFAAIGVPAVALNAFQVPMLTTSTYSKARLKKIGTERILKELDSGKVVLITGFQGVDKYDNVTTLGRGGSDTTAVAIAASMDADACEIYTDVDGVYTADPRIVPKARKLDEITYDEMLDLATLGAGVLHNRSVEMAKKYGVQLIVRSSLNRNEGTIVKGETSTMERLMVSGVAVDKNVARISVIGLEDNPGVAFKLFHHLARYNVNVDIILQSIGRDGTKDISFTVEEGKLAEALAVIDRHRKSSIRCQSVSVEENVAKVSIVGAGMMDHPGVAAKMFEALFDENINIKMISTSEIRVTVLIDESQAERAANAIHDKFELELSRR
ncbi:MAG: aspartate kinase [Lachnospiraceae bacterium]|nr:aspartate kinase [Lachnospiraceae bacterium]